MSDLSDVLWRKSRRSGSGNTCVEVADLAGVGIAVRDSTDPTGPTLQFSRTAWTALSAKIKGGALNHV
jgi:hypothetical protein